MRLATFRAFLITAAIMVLPPQLHAQEGYSSGTGNFIPVPPSEFETPPGTVSPAQTYKAQEKFADKTLNGSKNNPALGCAGTRCNEVAEEFRIRLLKHRIWALEHNEKTHRWQWRSGRRIFYSVLFIVVFGLFLSFLQFIPAWKRDLNGVKNAYPETELSVSEKDLKVSSPVIGVIILALSLGFFVAYLKMVYPLSYATLPDAAKTTESD